MCLNRKYPNGKRVPPETLSWKSERGLGPWTGVAQHLLSFLATSVQLSSFAVAFQRSPILALLIRMHVGRWWERCCRWWWLVVMLIYGKNSSSTTFSLTYSSCFLLTYFLEKPVAFSFFARHYKRFPLLVCVCVLKYIRIYSSIFILTGIPSSHLTFEETERVSEKRKTSQRKVGKKHHHRTSAFSYLNHHHHMYLI